MNKKIKNKPGDKCNRWYCWRKLKSISYWDAKGNSFEKPAYCCKEHLWGVPSVEDFICLIFILIVIRIIVNFIG